MLDNTAPYRRAAETYRDLAADAFKPVANRFIEAARLIDELCAELDATRETLRDRFAMAALTGYAGNRLVFDTARTASRNGKELTIILAELTYEVADAMLAARKPRTVPQDAGAEGAGDRH